MSTGASYDVVAASYLEAMRDELDGKPLRVGSAAWTTSSATRST